MLKSCYLTKLKQITLLIALTSVIISCPPPAVEKPENRVILCFDDRHESWRSILNRYSDKNVVFNFCISGGYTENPDVANLLTSIVENGHTIVNHTLDHMNFHDYKPDNEDFINSQIINYNNSLLNFYPVKSFAYPYGRCTPEWDKFLLNHFLRIRRFNTPYNSPKYYTNEEFRTTRILECASIDNGAIGGDLLFAIYTDKILEYFKKNPNSTTVLGCHNINNNGKGVPFITLDRLDYFVDKLTKNAVTFISIDDYYN